MFKLSKTVVMITSLNKSTVNVNVMLSITMNMMVIVMT
jgi:hypothetical protein